MNPDEIKEWLEPEEQGIHIMLLQARQAGKNQLKEFIELLQTGLAACRKLMKKHEWAGRTTPKEKKVFDDTPYACCLECGWEKIAHRERHAPGCKWDKAQAIEKGEGDG